MALITIAGKSYELVLENKAAWNIEAFRNRYSEVLERYDFIVGDWGYNQLRLKGFFKEGSNKATKDSAYAYATDYINEYCNFGCAYFILEKKADLTDGAVNVEIDPLLADLDQEYEDVLTDASPVYPTTPNTGEEKKNEQNTQVEIKSSKQDNRAQQNQQVQSKDQREQKDKPFKRRPFKHRQNKPKNGAPENKEVNVTSSEEAAKDAPKKQKRRPNKPFKRFDNKKNKEIVTTNQE